MSFSAEQIAEAKRAETFARFFDHVEMDGNAIGCWIWMAKKTRGYGYFSEGGKSNRAHRWLYQIIHGPVADDLLIRHKCDNPSCVNPRHLEVGSGSDNRQDALQRGRVPSRQGEKHPLAKIGADEVSAIRRDASLGFTQAAIAARFGISRQHVGKIVRRENWRHV